MTKEWCCEGGEVGTGSLASSGDVEDGGSGSGSGVVKTDAVGLSRKGLGGGDLESEGRGIDVVPCGKGVRVNGLSFALLHRDGGSVKRGSFTSKLVPPISGRGMLVRHPGSSGDWVGSEGNSGGALGATTPGWFGEGRFGNLRAAALGATVTGSEGRVKVGSLGAAALGAAVTGSEGRVRVRRLIR